MRPRMMLSQVEDSMVAADCADLITLEGPLAALSQ